MTIALQVDDLFAQFFNAFDVRFQQFLLVGIPFGFEFFQMRSLSVHFLGNPVLDKPHGVWAGADDDLRFLDGGRGVEIKSRQVALRHPKPIQHGQVNLVLKGQQLRRSAGQATVLYPNAFQRKGRMGFLLKILVLVEPGDLKHAVSDAEFGSILGNV